MPSSTTRRRYLPANRARTIGLVAKSPSSTRTSKLTGAPFGPLFICMGVRSAAVWALTAALLLQHYHQDAATFGVGIRPAGGVYIAPCTGSGGTISKLKALHLARRL